MSADSRRPDKPLRVGVLVDLEWNDRAGGHVKCWERFAEATARRDGDLDLTVHVQGPEQATVPFGPHARFVALPPVFSTERLRFLSNVADYTDLAPFHRRLWKALDAYDVIHTTDAYFAYAKTAARFAARRGVPLVTSLHTNTPGFTRAYSRKALERLFGTGALGRLMTDRLALPDRFGRNMERKLARYIRRCDAVLVSEQDDLGRHCAALPPDRRGILRRGIDTVRFNPARADQAALAARYAIPPTRLIVAFVGRLDISKNVMVLTRALRQALDAGVDLHAVMAGAGAERQAIADLLGDRVALAGTLPQDDLAAIYASADLFAFPSKLEVSPNVVLEAKASGAALLAAPGGGGVFVRKPGVDGIVLPADDPAAWAAAIAELAGDPERRAALGRAARADIEAHHPSWDDVLEGDLMPLWRRVAGR